MPLECLNPRSIRPKGRLDAGDNEANLRVMSARLLLFAQQLTANHSGRYIYPFAWKATLTSDKFSPRRQN